MKGTISLERDTIEQHLSQVLANRPLTLERRFICFVDSVRRALLEGKRYPESRHAEVVARTKEFIDAVSNSDCCARGAVDVYVDLAGKCRMALQLLEQPIPQKSQREIWEPRISKLWTGNGCERDMLWRILKPTDTISSADWSSITIVSNSGESRVWTREALRLLDRPAHSDKDDNAWVAMFDPIENPYPEAVDMTPIASSRVF